MAIQLFKLASRPMPQITATTSQVNRDYFHTWSRTESYVTYTAGTSVALAAADWVHGTGSTVSAFVTGGAKECLEINGVMQQSGLYSVAAGAITLIAPTGGLTLQKGYPITFQSYNVAAGVVVSTTETFAAS